MAQPTITVTLSMIAKLIDHALLKPNMTDSELDSGLATAKQYYVAAVCLNPYCISAAVHYLSGTDVLICSVVGFPHGNSTTEIKVAESLAAMNAGTQEIDMVVNVGKVLSGHWDYVTSEIAAVNNAVVAQGGILKVIFENAYLDHKHIVGLCKACTIIGVAFVKTSTGYGFVKQPDGSSKCIGATVPHIKLMKANCGPDVKVKAAGGVRTLDEFLYMMSLGVERIGTSGTAALLIEAKQRGISNEPTEVHLERFETSIS